MYEKGTSIPMTSNASFVPQNLSLLLGPKFITYAVISRNSVNLTTVDKHGVEADSKQIIPKISKDEQTASNNGPDNMLLSTLIQAKFLNVADRNILVICTTKGIFFFQDDGVTLLYFHSFHGNLKPSQTEHTAYCRGITAINTNLIAMGTSSGTVLLFEVPAKGPNITLVEEIKEKNLHNGITDLVANSNCLVASDTAGNIFAWLVRSVRDIDLIFTVYGKKNSVTCMGLWRSNLIASYGNGLVSIFNIEDGKKLIDISAHARWIHCLNVTGTGQFVTAGEDCFFRVWELNEINGRLKVTHLFSQLVPDTQICGIGFNYGSEQICVSHFDSSEIMVFNSI